MLTYKRAEFDEIVLPEEVTESPEAAKVSDSWHFPLGVMISLYSYR
jgi:hypothetical protein